MSKKVWDIILWSGSIVSVLCIVTCAMANNVFGTIGWGAAIFWLVVSSHNADQKCRYKGRLEIMKERKKIMKEHNSAMFSDLWNRVEQSREIIEDLNRINNELSFKVSSKSNKIKN